MNRITSVAVHAERITAALSLPLFMSIESDKKPVTTFSKLPKEQTFGILDIFLSSLKNIICHLQG